MKHPIVALVVVLLSAAICGIFVAPQAWLLFAGLVLIGTLGLTWPAISMRAVRVQVFFDQAWCTEGDTVHVQVKIHNRIPVPIWGLSLTSGIRGISGQQDEPLVSFSKITPWITNEFCWAFQPSQRGVYPDQQIFAESGFPFGVWTAKKKAEVAGSLVVFPKPVHLDAVPDIDGGFSFEEIFSNHKSGDAGDMMGTRPYRQGDSLRRVHWALTARTSRLICTERQAVLQSSAIVSLDACSDHHTTGSSDSSLEWSIRIFAGVCQEIALQGYQVRAEVGRDVIPVSSGKAGMKRLLTHLAKLPSTGLPQSECIRQSGYAAGLQVSVQTDRTPVEPSGLRIILKASSFTSKSNGKLSHSEKLYEEPVLQKGQIVISGVDEIRETLRQSWRRLCYDVS